MVRAIAGALAGVVGFLLGAYGSGLVVDTAGGLTASYREPALVVAGFLLAVWVVCWVLAGRSRSLVGIQRAAPWLAAVFACFLVAMVVIGGKPPYGYSGLWPSIGMAVGGASGAAALFRLALPSGLANKRFEQTRSSRRNL